MIDVVAEFKCRVVLKGSHGFISESINNHDG